MYDYPHVRLPAGDIFLTFPFYFLQVQHVFSAFVLVDGFNKCRFTGVLRLFLCLVFLCLVFLCFVSRFYVFLCVDSGNTHL